MIKIQYLKILFYSKTKHIMCNLTQYEPFYVWKQFLFVLLILTTLVTLVFLYLGDDMSSDPLLKLMVVPETENNKDLSESAVNNKYVNYISDKLVNLSEFKYLMKPSCDVFNVTKLLIITSFAANIESRSSHRRAYPVSALKLLGIKRVFLLGQLREHQSDIKQNALLNENERFSDLLQGSFFEAYRNLTYKHIMGLKWAVELPILCSNINDYNNKIKHIIKMDDDIVVDLYNLVNLINEEKNNNYGMIGYVLENVKAIRLKANKWYVSKEEYQNSFYPKFLSGWLYITTPNIANKLVQLSSYVNFFWIDDVYVTGILGNMINVKYRDIHDKFTLFPEYFECCIRDGIDCSILVGPNGGNNNLLDKYEKHIRKCIDKQILCPKVTISKHKCITQRKAPSIGKGFSELKFIKL